ncbi:N-acetyltransferase [Geobacillus thermodenitrificans]|nr:N-acetyltransferase [Geobacillus thermodenitrificans]NNU86450.1 GNAT family N-acetyltransferase [Geobacillus sp. MR]PJW13087.1 N-acetyltransferase [Geobacillus sp. Manikaran-105]PJW16215.1 N-acetyltransferase [Geobacillus sp. WSUCF-018B]QNU32916.1 GNAT family N-acetyltransferase [Geobacillus sp. 47C-IIb]QOR83782.1 GNAT family N-acetyltransferase [Geobacillus stearothermophilus]
MLDVNVPFEIRQATIQDIEDLTRLRLEFLKELGKIQSEQEETLVTTATKQYLEEALSNHEFISFVALSNHRIVSVSGIVLFKRPPSLQNLKGLEAYILNVYTIPPYRRKGLARTLLERCIEECKTIGVKRIWLHATEDGKPLYTKMGFTFKNSEMELFI